MRYPRIRARPVARASQGRPGEIPVNYAAISAEWLTHALCRPHRRAWERELLAYCLDCRHAASGPKIAFDEAWTYYRQHLCSSLIWWTSTLAMAYAQPRNALLELIGRIVTAVDDLDGVHSFA